VICRSMLNSRIISNLKKIGISLLCIWLITMVIDQSMDVSRLMDKQKYGGRSQIKFMRHINTYFSKDACLFFSSWVGILGYFVNGNYDAGVYYYDVDHFKKLCIDNVNKKYAIGSYKGMGTIRGIQLCHDDSALFSFDKAMHLEDFIIHVDAESNDNVHFEFMQDGHQVSTLNYYKIKSLLDDEKKHISFDEVKVVNNGSKIAAILKFTNAKDEISKWPINAGYTVDYVIRDDDHGWIVYAKEYLLGRTRPIPDGEPKVFDTQSVLAGTSEMKANIIINDGTSFLAEIVEASPLPKL